MEEVDCLVIGAGVVGLSVARAMALAGREVVVLEAETLIGSQMSSRNSEVIHAGIYYPRDSLKARLCVEGRRRMYAYCEERGVAHRKCGKLIVASEPEQLPMLADLLAKAEANGVEGMRILSKAETLEMEPALRAEGALLSPETGIVDSHGLMLAYQGEAEDHGAMLALGAAVTGGEVGEAGIVIEASGMTLRARTVVNCAALNAIAIAGSLRGYPVETLPKLTLARGNYFSLTGATPFSRLIYPAPAERGGLGVHLTLDLQGRARFGPDVEWIETVDYAVNVARGERFYDAIRSYWPDLPDGALAPAYAGIRPKIGEDPGGFADFTLHGPETHGVPGLWNLFGMESPGLTSSLAIGEWVRGTAMPA
ncbi:NAD(P)/FAD-dependent oxidoreductase [Albimonas sp. CAU 1670]|uniref:NAD(P)/FAD-dependent oxidoreductase n=1 Tax=Albimonas sp. CAU 1670 TaxID=3032599 RepID=UPI0023D9CB0F|nr:NAD(P)/FAD-dependent oxidoreductase [Albimonas sp. CAU 1670]MDF2233709.1 NAD(P)/FAD-dependent oxidoreductase [Albimonas sp. CAU 1670]